MDERLLGRSGRVSRRLIGVLGCALLAAACLLTALQNGAGAETPDFAASGADGYRIEYGVVTARISASGTISTTIDNPVVILGAPSRRGPDAIVTRAAAVGNGEFTISMSEWDPAGTHSSEDIPYLAVAAGLQRDQGQTWVAGSAEISDEVTTVQFDQDLGRDFAFGNSNPNSGLNQTILTTVASQNDPTPVAVEVTNVTQKSFDMRLVERSTTGDGGDHPAETVNWLAISSGGRGNGPRNHVGKVDSVERAATVTPRFGITQPLLFGQIVGRFDATPGNAQRLIPENLRNSGASSAASFEVQADDPQNAIDDREIRFLLLEGNPKPVCANPEEANRETLIPSNDTAAIQTRIDADGNENATFFFEAGDYRLTAPLRPKAGQTFRGEVRTNVNGDCVNVATLVGSETVNETDQWELLQEDPPLRRSSANEYEEGAYEDTGLCISAMPNLCRHPNDLFVVTNGVWEPLTKKPRKSDIKSKFDWYHHQAQNRILIHDDLAGQPLEYATTTHAFEWAADIDGMGPKINDVTIDHLNFAGFASELQHGAIAGSAGSEVVGWTVTNSAVTASHGSAIRLGEGSTFSHNVVDGTGGIALGARGQNIKIIGNVLRNTGYSGVKPGWEGGGLKFSGRNSAGTPERDSSKGSRVEGNCVHNNDGHGLWADVYADGLIINDNVVYANEGQGIFYEVSSNGTITNNLVGRNAVPKTGEGNWLWGAQIMLANSSGTTVEGNIVEVGGPEGIVGRSVGDPIAEPLWSNGITVTFQGFRLVKYPESNTLGNIIMRNEIIYRESSPAVSGYAAAETPTALDTALERESLSATDEAALRKLVTDRVIETRNEYRDYDPDRAVGFGDNLYYAPGGAEAARFWNSGQLLTLENSRFESPSSTIDVLAAVVPEKRDWSCGLLDN